MTTRKMDKPQKPENISEWLNILSLVLVLAIVVVIFAQAFIVKVEFSSDNIFVLGSLALIPLLVATFNLIKETTGVGKDKIIIYNGTGVFVVIVTALIGIGMFLIASFFAHETNELSWAPTIVNIGIQFITICFAAFGITLKDTS